MDDDCARIATLWGANAKRLQENGSTWKVILMYNVIGEDVQSFGWQRRSEQMKNLPLSNFLKSKMGMLRQM
jgi:hypothetical protein